MDEQRKYEYTGETKVVSGRTLRQIRATRNVGRWTKTGDVGGWIESDANLAHEGECWVAGDARVAGNARVFGDAWVGEQAHISGHARVGGLANVGHHARIYGSAIVLGRTIVDGYSHIYGDAQVGGNSGVGGDARGATWIGFRSRVHGKARVPQGAHVRGIEIVE